MKGKGGFTITEVLVATAVVVVSLGAILLFYIKCFELNETSKNLSLALQAAQKEVEEIKDHTFTQIFDDYNGRTFTVDGMAAGENVGVVEINNTNPDLLNVRVTVCWRQVYGRIIGEDRNLNGRLDSGEDQNGNGIMDSPAQITLLMASK